MRAHITFLAGTVLIFSAVSSAAPSPDHSQIMKGIAVEARQIESHAAQLEKLTADSSATWEQYDREWNEIQPAVETLEMKVARLERMDSSLSAAQKQALEKSKAACQKISWDSRQLGKLVDQVPPDLRNPKFKMESRNLRNEARDAAAAVQSGI